MLKVDGIKEAIADLTKEKRNLAKSLKELMETLFNEGYSIASAGYASAATSGVYDVRVVEPHWRRNTLILTAEGENVAFIEFGTGITYERYPDQSVYMDLSMADRGQYGLGKASKGTWIYVGKPGTLGEVIHTKKDGRSVIRTKGNPPARAMFRAGENIANQDHINDIARRVFND